MKSCLILVAGPVRSGTNDRPELIAANLNAMAQVALNIYRKGHIPVIGEWLALPLAKAAGSKETGDPISEEFLPGAYLSGTLLLHVCARMAVIIDFFRF